MPKVRKTRLIAIAGVGLVAVIAFIASNRRAGITEETFDRIQPDMTRAEVEAILGPPGDYTTEPSDEEFPPLEEVEHYYYAPQCRIRPESSPGFISLSSGVAIVSPRPNQTIWKDDNGTLSVVFDQDDTVEMVEYSTYDGQHHGLLDRVVRLFQRQSPRWLPGRGE